MHARRLCQLTALLLVPASGPRAEAGPPPPRPTTRSLAARKPASPAARRVLALVHRISRTLTKTRYQGVTRVNARRGIYLWDCSGMADWILRRAARRARRALRKGRPLARDFYRVIARSPRQGSRQGWQRLSGPHGIRPGDLFAWLKPPMLRKRKNTGHVGFVLSTPRPHPRYRKVWLMRIADASSFQHENDSRPIGGPGGFGTGTIAFLMNGKGDGTAYGWYGSLQPPDTFIPTKIIFGRVWR